MADGLRSQGRGGWKTGVRSGPLPSALASSVRVDPVTLSVVFVCLFVFHPLSGKQGGNDESSLLSVSGALPPSRAAFVSVRPAFLILLPLFFKVSIIYICTSSMMVRYA